MTGIRSYLAGTGVSGSLLAAAALAFISVTAFVAFDGVPIGADDDGAATVSIDGPDSAAAAAVAAAGPPATIAAAPATPGPAAAAASPGAGGLGIPAAAVPVGGGAAPAAPPGVAPGGGSAASTDVPAGGGPAAPAPTNSVDDAVASVDSTVEGATGVNPGLGEATKPITSAVDDILQDGANGLTGGGRAEPAEAPVP